MKDEASAILAHIAALEARAKEAEAREATLREALADLLSWFDGGPSSYGPWIIKAGEYGADDAVRAARQALAATPAARGEASEDLQADKRRIDGLRELCGYVEDGSETSVRISQDDATRDWIIRADKRWWHGKSLRAALDAALGDTRHD